MKRHPFLKNWQRLQLRKMMNEVMHQRRQLHKAILCSNVRNVVTSFHTYYFKLLAVKVLYLAYKETNQESWHTSC